MRNLLLLARGVALAALAISLGGCGGKLPQYDVTGKVMYNGVPLAKPDGQIVFVGPDGTQVPATISPDGTFKAAKVTSGLNRVAIYYPNPAFTKPTRPAGGPSPKSRPAATAPQFLTPEKYASAETSQQSVEVKEGTVFNVEMTGPAIP